MSDIVQIVVAIVAVVGASATYVLQKRVDRRSALIEMRRQCYRDFLRAFMMMTGAAEYDRQIVEAHNLAEMDLLVVGSDRVITAVGNLSKFYADTNDTRMTRDAGRVRELVASVCAAMRRDCFEKTDLTTTQIEDLVRIG